MPEFSISQISTLRASFDEDVAAYERAGLDGMGIWELKLDERSLETFEASGLGAASAVPEVPSILPLPLLGGPTDPQERLDALCASVHRLAAFRPSGIVCLTGSGTDRDTVVDGLRTLAHEAELARVRIALEPYQREGGEAWSFVSTIPEAVELIEAAGGSPALSLQFDVWHLWNTPTLYEYIAREVGRFAGVHVNDVREPTRGWADRVLPGDGIAPVPRILAALEDAGWDGYYDLEIFSDNGAFGADYPDSLWNVSVHELAQRGRDALEDAWNRRRASPVPA